MSEIVVYKDATRDDGFWHVLEIDDGYSPTKVTCRFTFSGPAEWDETDAYNYAWDNFGQWKATARSHRCADAAEAALSAKMGDELLRDPATSIVRSRLEFDFSAITLTPNRMVTYSPEGGKRPEASSPDQ